MCGSEGAWVEEGWKPFTALGHDLVEATHVVTDADADAPLRRDAQDPSVAPGIPLA